MLVRANKKWDYAIGMIKVDGLEPTDDMKKLIEKEKKGEISMEDIRKALDQKYKMKEFNQSQLCCFVITSETMPNFWFILASSTLGVIWFLCICLIRVVNGAIHSCWLSSSISSSISSFKTMYSDVS